MSNVPSELISAPPRVGRGANSGGRKSKFDYDGIADSFELVSVEDFLDFDSSDFLAVALMPTVNSATGYGDWIESYNAALASDYANAVLDGQVSSFMGGWSQTVKDLANAMITDATDEQIDEGFESVDVSQLGQPAKWYSIRKGIHEAANGFLVGIYAKFPANWIRKANANGERILATVESEQALGDMTFLGVVVATNDTGDVSECLSHVEKITGGRGDYSGPRIKSDGTVSVPTTADAPMPTVDVEEQAADRRRKRQLIRQKHIEALAAVNAS